MAESRCYSDLMRWLFGSSRHPSWTMTAFIAVLLAVLAALQYWWTGELSRAENERLQTLLGSSASLITHEIDREVTRALLHFQPDQSTDSITAGERYSSLLSRWRTTAPYPDLVEGIFEARRSPAGLFELRRLDTNSERFESLTWPAELEPLRNGLQDAATVSATSPLELLEMVPLPLAASVPALVLPTEEFETASGGPSIRPSDASLDDLQSALSTCVIVQLDLDYLRQTLLPHLVQRFLTTNGRLEYDVMVVLDDSLDKIIFLSDAALSAGHFRTPDAEAPMFGLLPVEELRALYLEQQELVGTATPGKARPWGFRWMSVAASEHAPGPPRWRLLIRHGSGSLETLVAQNRIRNLAVVLAVLILLALSLTLILASSRRARNLAERQMEFVAGVSHELRTPLAAIRLLSENLADGLVHGEEQVRSYGTALRSEEKRLSRMVDQVLDFARPRSGPDTLTLRRVDLRSVVEQALDDSKALLGDCEVELDLPTEPLPAAVDPEAFSRAIHNLITNAAKYGGDSRWVGIRAALSNGQGQPEIVITVSDRGKGISRDSLGLLFDPFFRSPEVRQAQIPGSGLGLSLVKRIVEDHEGRVEVSTTPGEGSSFTIHLPATHPPTTDTETDERTDPPR